MTTYLPTPEEFMTLTEPDEPEVDEGKPVEPADPLTSIANSLQRLVATVEGRELDESVAVHLREAYDDLEAKHGVVLELVEEISAIIKPSTSKLADSVRAAITRWSAPVVEPVEVVQPEPVEPEPAPDDDQPPEQDADVEEWRAYARARGYTGPDIDTANRSQIRTMLGIEHGASA